MLYRMKPGGVRELVETEFGFHILQLNGIRRRTARGAPASHILIPRPIAGKPRADARADRDRDEEARAGKRFNDTAEAFGNLVYEQPDSLKPAAERFKLQGDFALDRQGVNPGSRPLDNAKLLGALFSQDSSRTSEYRCDRGCARHAGVRRACRTPAGRAAHLRRGEREIARS